MKKIINLLFCFMLLGCTNKSEGPISNLENPIEYMMTLSDKGITIEKFDENIYKIKQDSGISYINFNTFEYIDVGEIFNWKKLSIIDWGYDVGCNMYYDEFDSVVKLENCGNYSDYSKNFQIQYMASKVLHLLTKDYVLDKDVSEPFARAYDVIEIKEIKKYLTQINEYIDEKYALDDSKKSDAALQEMKNYYCTRDSLTKGSCEIG